MTITKITKDQPTPAQLHIDTWLTNISVGWAQDPSKFVAGKVFPMVPVQKQSDKFVIWDKGFFFRDEVGVRPLGGRPNRAGKAKKDGTYFCEEEGLEDVIDDRTRANADQPFDPDRASGELLTEQMMIHLDREWSNAYFKAGVWGTNIEGKSSSPSGENQILQFDQDGSEPIQTIRKNSTRIGRRTGRKPNKVVLGGDVFDVLCDHPDIVDRVKYTQRGVLTQELLAELFGVDEVLVPGGVENSAAEGQADDIDFIVDSTSVLLAYAASAPAINSPTAGYTFVWTGLIPGMTNAFGGVIQRGRDELAHSDILQIRAASDPEIVAPELGVFIEGAIG
jgi:hypothetical protein